LAGRDADHEVVLYWSYYLKESIETPGGQREDGGAMAETSGGTVDLRLRAAVESSPSGLLMIDPEGRIVLVNLEVERLFGFPREELLGRSIDMLVPERFRGHHAGFRTGFFADPRARSMGAGRDLYGLRKDGSEVPVEIGLTPVATEEGLFVLSSIVDISARKRADARFRAAVESSPNGMVMIDQTGRIVLVNREVERLFGYPRTDLLGRSIEDLVPERYRGRHPGFRDAFFRNPQTRTMGAGRELFGLRKDGKEIPVEIGLNPIETEEGVFVLGSIVDISARKEAEDERRKLEDQLQQSQKMEAVGTLAGGIAHDFNNVLGVIVGYAELALKSVQDRPAALSDISELLNAAQRGRQVVERIVAFSRRHSPDRQPLDLTRTLAEGQKLLRPTIPATIELRFDIPAEPLRVSADAISVHQVLLNLATNAVHAMPNGGGLEVRLQRLNVYDSVVRNNPDLREGHYVVLSVCDTGIGMDEKTRQRIFEPFFTTKPPGAGSGLGLAVVHAIMRDLGGAILVESEVGTGTRFGCFFPALEAEEAPSEIAVKDVPLGQGERILYVDDEAELVKIGRRRLESLNYHTVGETSPERVLEHFRARPGEFDLVVTDHTMPRMTGLDLARELMKIRPDIPILLLTGFIQDLPQERLRAVGIRLLLRKPATVEELGTAVRAVLDS